MVYSGTKLQSSVVFSMPTKALTPDVDIPNVLTECVKGAVHIVRCACSEGAWEVLKYVHSKTKLTDFWHQIAQPQEVELRRLGSV